MDNLPEVTDEEIIFDLYCLMKENAKIAEDMVIEMCPKKVMCHCCMTPIKKGERFIAFHDVHEAIRYVKTLCWKEER